MLFLVFSDCCDSNISHWDQH